MSEPRTVHLYGDNLIGDALMTTPALRALKALGTMVYYTCGTSKGAEVLFEGNPHIDLFRTADQPKAPYQDKDHIQLDAWRAFEWAHANGKTISQGFGHLCGVEVTDLSYMYDLKQQELDEADDFRLRLGGENPLVLCARHSASCSSNDPKIRIANKCLENRHWVEAAHWILKEGWVPVAIGSREDAKDPRYAEWPGKKLYGAPLRTIAALTRICPTLTVDTGIRHLAAAAGGDLFCISAAIPLSLIRCEPIWEKQRIVEEHRPLQYANAKSLIAGFKKIAS